MTVGVYNKTILKAKEVEQWTARSLALSSRRKAKGLTQKQLADRLSVTDKAVSKWERGLGFPDIKLLEPLSQALDVSILELMRSYHVVLVAMGVILLVVSWKRHRQKLTYSFTLLLAVLALVFPIILFLFLAFAFVLGGPIPQ